MPTTTPENASDLYKSQITDIAVPSPANKAAAVLLTPINGKQIFVNGSDGGWFTGFTGLAPATLADNGGAFCGTEFIPTGGDGSAGWEREEQGEILAIWFGVQPTIDNTISLQLWLDYLFSQSGGLGVIPDFDCLYTSDLVPQINGTISRTFCIRGGGKSISRLLTNNGSSFKIHADVAPAKANVFVDLHFMDLTITSSAALTGNGLDLYSVQKSVFSGVGISGFNYGCFARSSWNITVDQRCQFDGNNVGFKVPKEGSGATLNEGVNAINLSGISLANNVKAGASIGFANVITLSDIRMESNPVAIYIPEAVSECYINQIYYEGGSVTKTETDKDGTLTNYAVITGKDEDGVLGDTAKPNGRITISKVLSNTGEGKLWLDNVTDVWIPYQEYSRGYVRLGDNVKNIHANSLAGDDRFTDLVIPGVSRNFGKRIFTCNPMNWIANGDFSLPGLPYINYSGTASGVRSTQNLDDATASNVLDVTLPATELTVDIRFDILIPVGGDYGVDNSRVMSVLHAMASSADIASVKLDVQDQNGTSIITAITKTSGLTDWFTINVEGDINANRTPVTLLLYKVTVTRTTGTGDEHLYIENAILADQNAGPIQPPQGQSVLNGLSVAVTTSTDLGSGTLRYTGTFDTGFTNAVYYDVILTPRRQGDVAINFATTKSGGVFTVHSTVLNVVFDALIIPKVNRLV